MLELQIIVAAGCGTSEEARRLGETVQTRFPSVVIDVIDIARQPERQPDNVIAVPTFLLDGRVISLGNPSEDVLCNLITDRLRSMVMTPPEAGAS